MSIRTEQISSVIHREVSQLFAEVLDETEYGLVTVTRVEVFPDLSEARIYVSSLSNSDNLLDMLERRRGYIRRTVSPRLYLKVVPKFRFLVDNTGKEAEHIESLLKKG